MSTKKSNKNNYAAEAASLAVIAANELQPANISIADVTDSKSLTMLESAVVSNPVTEDTTAGADTAGEDKKNESNSSEGNSTEGTSMEYNTVESQLTGLSDAEREELRSHAGHIKKSSTRESDEAVKTGKRLIRVKAILAIHGIWEKLLKDWLAEECDFSMRTARRFMQIARIVEKKPELKGLPITKIEVLNRLKGGKKKREEFLEDNVVDNLSTRKLEELVRTTNNGGKPPVLKPKAAKKTKTTIESVENEIVKLFKEINTQDDSEKNATYDKLRNLCQQTLENIPSIDETTGA